MISQKNPGQPRKAIPVPIEPGAGLSAPGLFVGRADKSATIRVDGVLCD